MSNHLDVLKHALEQGTEQGVEVWNAWRRMYRMDQRSHLNLYGADLRGADLGGFDLSRTNLSRADLRHAILWGADLSDAIMIGADLSYARLDSTNLHSVIMDNADLRGVSVSSTNFADIDLRTVKGLKTLKHLGPSTIGIDTIIKSQGKISKIFLRKAGIPSSVIEAIPSLIGSLEPIQYYTCFISYSSRDQDFAERLYADLQAKGVRCWFAPQHMRIGDKLRPRIEESIRLYDKLLLVLSEHSIKSNWVAYEVERALNKEPEGIPNVLFPIRLDDTVMQSKAGWADDIRRTRHIGDFTCWKDHDAYQKAYTRLLRDLKAEAQKMGSRDATTNDR